MAIRVTRAGMGLAVGIILLAAVVFGGLWLVKDRGEQARREEAVKIAEQKLNEESSREVATESQGNQQEQEEQNQQEQANQQQNGSATLPGATQNESENTNTSGTTATELPQTGPVENALVAIVAIGLITFTGVSYLRSRRLLFETR